MGSNGKDPTQIIERARMYVLGNLLNARTDISLTETDALLEGGIIDSMGLVELISFIQDEFSIHISNDEITEDNFATLARIGSYVLSKRAAATPS
jgi:acyl carrier protein